MIDLLSLGISHALLLLAAWRLAGRADLDRDQADTPRQSWGFRRDA